MGRVVFGLLGIYIPFLAYDENNDDAHILSEEVWIAVKKFCDETLEFATKGSTVSLDDYLKQYNAYEAVLRKELNEFAMQLISLMRLAARIRRPFFGRTVGIIKMWEILTSCEGVKKATGANARRGLIK